MGDAAGAEGPLREAIRLNPGFAAARADLGWALLVRGSTAEADAEFAKALELEPLRSMPRQQLEWREWLRSGRAE